MIFKRPESVLVVVHTRSGLFLLLERVKPEGFWQSVTGSLEWGESAAAAARRELLEETGIDSDHLIDHGRECRFPILPAWAPRYHPLTRVNRESLFSLCLDEPVEPRLSVKEHSRFEWLSADVAAEQVYSWTNREAILMLASELP
ncbi:MAG: dihydroneopterin triphosphate diphosphatase [Gammaproteobacteria bacterium]